MDAIMNNLIEKFSIDGLLANHCKKIQNCNQNEKRILFVMKMHNKYNIVPPKVIVRQKNSEQSKKYRDEGNQIYSHSHNTFQLLKACEEYSKSIAFAPNESAELSIAHANKSAVLFRLKNYKECVQAIDNCLNSNYPNDLRIKVLLRKAECLAALNSPHAKKNYHETRKWIEKNVPTVEEKEKMKNKLKDCCKKDANAKQQTDETDLRQVFKDFHYKKISDEVPSSSDALTIRYNETFGRHIIATRNIRPGEILAKEAPYISVLRLTKRYLYCWKCLEIVWNCVPCERCVYVVYCSEKCKQEAWMKFHAVECNVLPHMLALNSEEFVHKGVASLRMAILGLKELGSIANLKAELIEVDRCADPRVKGFARDGTYYSNKYRSIYSLCTTTNKRDGLFLLHPLTYASLVVYILATETTFFGQKFNGWEDLHKNEDVAFVGSLIFKNLEIIHTNGFSAKESMDVEDRKKGVAILPFFSFLNHSCKPNIAKSCRKDYDFLYATYPIQKGEQVFISYIPDYASTPKLSRQQNLLHIFLFTCECIACRENWPLMNQYPTINEIVPNIDKALKLTQDIQQISLYFTKPISEHIKSIKDVPIILESLRNTLEIILNNITLPCKEAETIIRKIMILFEKSKYIQEIKSLEIS